MFTLPNIDRTIPTLQNIDRKSLPLAETIYLVSGGFEDPYNFSLAFFDLSDYDTSDFDLSSVQTASSFDDCVDDDPFDGEVLIDLPELDSENYDLGLVYIDSVLYLAVSY